MARLLKILVLSTCLLTTYACVSGGKKAHENAADDIDMLIGSAETCLDTRRLDEAMTQAYSALKLAGDRKDALRHARALLCIARIDIKASRDTSAWQASLQAEEIARRNKFGSELAQALVTKAKLCSYAEISPETGRNREGIEYALEALSIAKANDDWKNQAEACYALSALYVNMNRWNDTIDESLYAKAGEYIDMGEAIAREHRLEKTAAAALLHRSRWLQQGGFNKEAILSYSTALESLPDTEHLTASNLLDHLMNLYMRIGDTQKALECHNRYVYHQQQYLNQMAEASLKDIQTNYEVQTRNTQIQQRNTQLKLLLVIIAAILSAIIILFAHFVRERRSKKALQRLNALKEEFIASMRTELNEYESQMTSNLKHLSSNVERMSNDALQAKIRKGDGIADINNKNTGNQAGAPQAEKKNTISASGLSEREIQVIRLSIKGLTAAQIAQQLYLSVHTVNTHRQRIYAKLGVKNVSGMILKAAELGII